MGWYFKTNTAACTLSLSLSLYHMCPNKHAVLDFRISTKQVRQLQPHFWYILYSEDYTSATLRRQGQEDEVIRLVGDYVVVPSL